MKFHVKNRSRICMTVSAAIMALALVLSLAGYGINYGIDFAGGLSIRYEMGAAFEQADVEAALRAAGVSEFQIAKAGDAQTELQLRIKAIENEEGVQTLRATLEGALAEQYPAMAVDDATVSYVGPVAGQTLVRNAIWSVLIAALLMLGYIALRFDFDSGLAAVIGLAHDVLIMLSFMVLLRSVIQMNSSFIAAMLTIVGYSINNTIVIFDRIRENNKKASLGAISREEVVNISIRESLGRTINTTLTTLATIVALYILGVDSIREFALPIIIGILAGVYSANMINGYIWAMLAERRRAAKRVRKSAKAK